MERNTKEIGNSELNSISNYLKHDSGVREGKGKEWSVQKGKQLHYDGQWHEDKYSGEGKMIFSDGSIYEGHWYNGNNLSFTLF